MINNNLNKYLFQIIFIGFLVSVFFNSSKARVIAKSGSNLSQTRSPKCCVNAPGIRQCPVGTLLAPFTFINGEPVWELTSSTKVVDSPTAELLTMCDSLTCLYPKGNDLFCSLYTCYPDNSTCECYTSKSFEVKDISVSGINYRKESLSTYNCSLFDPDMKVPDFKRKSRSDDDYLNSLDITDPLFLRGWTNDTSVCWQAFGLAPYTGLVSKDNWTFPFEMQPGTNTCCTSFPIGVTMTSGYVHIWLIDARSYAAKVDMFYTGNTFCQVFDCFFCSSTINTWKCMPVTSQVMYVFILIFFILASIILLPFAVKLIIWLMYYLYRGAVSIPKMKVMRSMRRKATSMMEMEEDIETPIIINTINPSAPMISMLEGSYVNDKKKDKLEKVDIKTVRIMFRDGGDLQRWNSMEYVVDQETFNKAKDEVNENWVKESSGDNLKFTTKSGFVNLILMSLIIIKSRADKIIQKPDSKFNLNFLLLAVIFLLFITVPVFGNTMTTTVSFRKLGSYEKFKSRYEDESGETPAPGTNDIVSVNGVPCTSVFLINVDVSTSCFDNGNYMTCSVTFSQLVAISSIGAACLSLKDSVTNNFLGVLTIGVNGIKESFGLANNYMTSDWTVATQSNDRCCGAGGCAGNCYPTNPDKFFDGNLAISGVNINAFQSYCGRSGGCAGNGCPLCCDKCVYGLYTIFPSSVQASVNSVTNNLILIDCYIMFSDSNGVVTLNEEFIITQAQSIVTVNGITVSFLGVFNTIQTQFLNNYIIITNTGTTNQGTKFNNDVFIGPASGVNSPIAGTVGDWQWSSGTTGLNGKYPQNMITATQAGNAWGFTWNQAGINNLVPGAIKLPGVYQGTTWTYDNTSYSISTQRTNMGSTAFTIDSATSFNITKIVNVVCPVTSWNVDHTVQGCYACEAAAKTNITVCSSCAIGTCMLSVDQDYITLYNNSVILTNVPQCLPLVFFSTVSSINFNLKIQCPTPPGQSSEDYCTTINIYGTLTAVDLIGNNPINTGNNTNPIGPSTCSSFICNFKIGRLPWWQWLLTVIVLLIMLAASIFFLFLIKVAISAAIKSYQMKKAAEYKKIN